MKRNARCIGAGRGDLVWGAVLLAVVAAASPAWGLEAEQVKKDLSDEIVNGVLIALVGWVLTNVIAFGLQWYKLHTFLILMVNFHLQKLRENRDYVEKFAREHIQAGQPLPSGAKYTETPCKELDDIREQCIRILWPAELRRVVAFALACGEFETLMSGLFAELTSAYKERQPLTQELADHLQSKASRILSYEFPERIGSLLHLPETYDAKPATQVT